jgi:Zn finger protein HypA/HybF involved in hydrogenase expression
MNGMKIKKDLDKIFCENCQTGYEEGIIKTYEICGKTFYLCPKCRKKLIKLLNE